MLRRSIGCVLAMGAFAVAAANAACGTAGPSDEGAPGVADPWAISASGETSSALGVQAWGFRKVDATTLSVRGYDADNHLVVEVRQRITMSDGQHWALDLGVARSERTSTLHIDLQAQSVEGGAQVTAAVPSDTISADDAARKILERLEADTHLPIGRTSGSGADIGTQSLSALTLTGGNGGGLTDGNGNIIGDGGADGSATNGNGGNGGGGNNGGGNSGGGNDKCGGDMLGGLQPILGALSSVGPALFTAFTGIFQCVKEAGDAGFSFDIGVGTGFQNIPLQALATCTFKQVLQQASGGGQGGDAGAGGNPLGGLGGLGGGGGGGGAGDLTGLLGGLLGGFTSMGSSGQSCGQ